MVVVMPHCASFIHLSSLHFLVDITLVLVDWFIILAILPPFAMLLSFAMLPSFMMLLPFVMLPPFAMLLPFVMLIPFHATHMPCSY